MFLSILYQWVLQILLPVAIIVLFGLLIQICHSRFYSSFGNLAPTVAKVTGFIGTPVHELSHALFCVLFFHKIKRISLFTPNSDDGTLGSVDHSFNPRNPYQRIGNFFIGIGPIIVIAALLCGLSYLFIPSMMAEIHANAQITANEINIDRLYGIFSHTFSSIGSYIGNKRFWLFVFIGSFFALHMSLSKPDMKTAASGFITLAVTTLIVDIIMGYVNAKALILFTNFMLKITMTLLTILTLSLFISLVLMALAYLYRITIGRRIG